MMRFPHLAQRLFNTPIAITPEKAEIVMAALADRLGITHLFRDGVDALAGQPVALLMDDDGPAEDRGYDVIGGVGIVPVCGTLVHKLGALRPYSGMCGYDGIRLSLLQALEDDDVDAVVLDIDSPGGEVAGCFDLADTILRMRGRKPVWAILNEMACSAAYALASAADHITIPRTGVIGSIGVVWMHCDLSKALAGAGITVTVLQYGDRKTDAAEVLPLSKDARTRIQADIDQLGDLFVRTVARNRGIDPAGVRAQQAGCFLGAAGVEMGLADAVMAPDEALRALVDSL